MNEGLGVLILGGLLLGGAIVGHKAGYDSEASKAIKLCEASLPRDRNCKIIAVVDDNKENKNDPSTSN